MMLIKLAWLNIWRNKRRTLITTASVFFAVLLAILMRSMSEGVYENMIHNVVSYSSGYIQIHQQGYWDEQSIDNTFEASESLNDKLLQNKHVLHLLPRLETFALASHQKKTKGVLLMGIDSEKEKEINHLHKKIIDGEFLESNQQRTVVIGEGLAHSLRLQVNDTIVLLGQGYHASMAAGKFRVQGIIKLGSPELNNNLVYMPILQAQILHGAENRLSAISLILSKSSNLNGIQSKLNKSLDVNTYEIMSWKEMMPELDQFIEVDSAGNYIFIGVLYIIISFGLFGTLLMMSFERKREFGILIAIGMKKHLLAFILLLESIMISLVGCILGLIVSVGLVNWFYNHPIYFSGELKKVYENYGIEPIIYFSSSHTIFIYQASIILLLSILLALYPGFTVIKLKPVNALNS